MMAGRERSIATKRVVFYKDGDIMFTPVHMTITPSRYRSYDALLVDLNKKMDLIHGVRQLYTPLGVNTVSDLDGFEDGGKYVCSSNATKKIKKLDYAHPPKKKPPGFAMKRQRTMKPPVSLNNGNPGGTRLFNSSTDQKVVKIIAKEDRKKTAKLLLNRRTAPTMEVVLQNSSDLLQLNSGVVDHLQTLNGGKVTNLEELMSGPNTLLAVGRYQAGRKTSALSLPSLSGKRSISSNNSRLSRTKTDPLSIKTNENKTAAKAVVQKYTKRDLCVSMTVEEECKNNVYITIYGEHGSTDELVIRMPPKGFQAASVHESQVQVQNVGDIYKLRVHGGVETSLNWCTQITAEDKETRELFVFACDLTDAPLCDGVREMPVMKSGTPVRPAVMYTIEIETGQELDAGTDSNVYIKLEGSKGCGDSGKRYLKKSISSIDNMCQPGSVDLFVMESVYLGEIRSLTVGHDNDGTSPSWYVEKVFVKEKGSNEVYTFVCQKWFDSEVGDRKTEKTFSPLKGSATLPPINGSMERKPRAPVDRKSDQSDNRPQAKRAMRNGRPVASPKREESPTKKMKNNDDDLKNTSEVNQQVKEKDEVEHSDEEDDDDHCATPAILREFASHIVQQTLERAVIILKAEMEAEAQTKSKTSLKRFERLEQNLHESSDEKSPRQQTPGRQSPGQQSPGPQSSGQHELHAPAPPNEPKPLNRRRSPISPKPALPTAQKPMWGQKNVQQTDSSQKLESDGQEDSSEDTNEDHAFHSSTDIEDEMLADVNGSEDQENGDDEVQKNVPEEAISTIERPASNQNNEEKEQDIHESEITDVVSKTEETSDRTDKDDSNEEFKPKTDSINDHEEKPIVVATQKVSIENENDDTTGETSDEPDTTQTPLEQVNGNDREAEPETEPTSDHIDNLNKKEDNDSDETPEVTTSVQKEEDDDGKAEDNESFITPIEASAEGAKGDEAIGHDTDLEVNAKSEESEEVSLHHDNNNNDAETKKSRSLGNSDMNDNTSIEQNKNEGTDINNNTTASEAPDNPDEGEGNKLEALDDDAASQAIGTGADEKTQDQGDESSNEASAVPVEKDAINDTDDTSQSTSAESETDTVPAPGADLTLEADSSENDNAPAQETLSAEDEAKPVQEAVPSETEPSTNNGSSGSDSGINTDDDAHDKENEEELESVSRETIKSALGNAEETIANDDEVEVTNA